MIVGWKNPLDGQVFGLEDYAALDRVIPEPVLRAMAKKIKTDTRHQGPNITITSGLGCPRKMLIQRMLPVTPDPTKMWKMHRGTWLHECIGLSFADNEDWVTEEKDPDACTFSGRIFDIDMSCRIDARRLDFTKLIDWKFRADGAEKWIDPMGRAKDEDAAQLNMARILMEQVTGKDLTNMDMYVWVMSGQTVRTTVPWMSEEQIGAIRPGGGIHTIREIFGMLDESCKAWKAMGTGEYVPSEQRGKFEAIISALPMVGETMYQNKRNKSLNCCTRYCEVNEECYACEGGI